MADLGLAGGARMNATLRARRAAARHARAAAGQVDLPSRRAARRDERRARARHELPRRGRHALDARRGPRARRARGGARPGELVIHGPGLRGAAAGAAIDVGNAGTLLRLLPGWLAGQPRAAAGRSTATRASAAARSTASRGRSPRWARSSRRARAASRRSRSPGGRCTGSSTTLPVASAQIKCACCSPACSPTGATTVVEPEPSRDHTERLLAAAGAGADARDGDRITVTAADELALEAIHVPGDPSSAAFHVAAAALVPARGIVIEGWRRTGPASASSASSSGWARR